jgi:glycosyltransferase involved in cell wall biosynthesis
MNLVQDPIGGCTQPHVCIVLATYNGARYLDIQLQSIAAQTHRNWSLLIRDDGSSDDTMQVLSRWQAEHPAKIRFVEGVDANRGPAGNFSALLECADAPYVALCDQDDVWQPDRLELGLARIRAIEALRGADHPTLVHSDLEVVDADLNTIATSLWHHQFLRPDRERDLRHVMVQNVVTGCSALMNRSLVRLATPIPSNAVMHDWWIALVAASLGSVDHLDLPLVRYRQHGRNDTGAKPWGLRFVYRQALSMVRSGKTRASLLATQAQAEALLGTHGAALSTTDRILVEKYAYISKQTAVQRRWRLLSNRIHMTGASRNIGLYLSI